MFDPKRLAGSLLVFAVCTAAPALAFAQRNTGAERFASSTRTTVGLRSNPSRNPSLMLRRPMAGALLRGNGRFQRLTRASRLVGTGTAARLRAVDSSAQGDHGAAAELHGEAAQRYEQAARQFNAAQSPAQGAVYAGHAANEYGLAGNAAGAARARELAQESRTTAASRTETSRTTPQTGASTTRTPAMLARATAGTRLVSNGTAARLQANQAAAAGRAGDAARLHEEAAALYDRAAVEFRAGGDPGQADAFARHAQSERSTAAQFRRALITYTR